VKLARRAVPFLVLTLVALPSMIAQVPQFTPFTADMHMTSTSEHAPHDVTGKIFVGSGHMRMNMSAGGHESAIISDFATKTVDILMIEPKMYMQHQAGMGSRHGVVNNPAEDMKPFDPNNPCANQPDVTCKKIGMETVSGRTCDHWEITDKNGRVSNVWIDQKLNFPIKMVSGETTIVLSNIKEGQPDAALFQVPADFKKLDMRGMMPQGTGAPPNN